MSSLAIVPGIRPHLSSVPRDGVQRRVPASIRRADMRQAHSNIGRSGMAYGRHIRLGSLAIGYWWALPVGHKGTPGYAAEKPEASATPSEAVAEVRRWIGAFDGEIDADPERPDRIVEVRLDRTRGIDPLGSIDGLQEDDLRKLRLLPETQKPHAGSPGRLIGRRFIALR